MDTNKVQLLGKRDPSMDIIRCFALLFVVCVHFFLKIRFYEEGEIVAGWRMYTMVFLRSFFMICVPLFLLLSGFLQCNKKIEKSYYKKLIYTVAIAYLACICCITYRTIFLDVPFSLVYSIKAILDFSAAPYSWYVRMYVCLFLLIPFLNILYSSLKSKKQKQLLILTFFVITSLPLYTNIFFPDINIILQPSISNKRFVILSEYWLPLYPIMYYFIGAYLREYGIPLSKKSILLLSALTLLVNSTFCFYRAYGSNFKMEGWTDHSSPLVLIQSVLFFAFFQKLDYSKFPAFASKILKHISGMCFGAYLVSWIFDDAFYKILNSHIPDMRLRLNYFFLLVPAVYICSLFLSFLINKFYDLINFCALSIQKLIKSSTN